MIQESMQTIQVRGVDHYYEWIGEFDTSKEKPVMVFIHGWGGSSRYWRRIAWALSDQFNCLLYDLRGFGRSRLPDFGGSNPEKRSYAMEDYAEDLAVLLDIFNLEAVYLHSHSMGASISLFFLNRYPQRVKKAILACNGLLEYDAKAFAAFHKFSRYVVQFRYNWFLNIPFAEKLFMARFLHRPLKTSICRDFLSDFLLADDEAALGTVYTSVSKKAVDIMPQEFSKIQVQTLLISGEYDKIITAEMGRQAAALNQKIEYQKILNTGHFPMLEDVETYLQKVQNFLKV